MNERIVSYTFNLYDPDNTAGLGALSAYFMIPFGATLIYASGAPMVDDPGTTLDLMDDTVACGPTAMVAATKIVPGEWISTHCGGTETPVEIAAGSVMSYDLNALAVGISFSVVFLFLVGESWG